jgi:hypothetical protein
MNNTDIEMTVDTSNLSQYHHLEEETKSSSLDDKFFDDWSYGDYTPDWNAIESPQDTTKVDDDVILKETSSLKPICTTELDNTAHSSTTNMNATNTYQSAVPGFTLDCNTCGPSAIASMVPSLSLNKPSTEESKQPFSRSNNKHIEAILYWRP